MMSDDVRHVDDGPSSRPKIHRQQSLLTADPEQWMEAAAGRGDDGPPGRRKTLRQETPLTADPEQWMEAADIHVRRTAHHRAACEEAEHRWSVRGRWQTARTKVVDNRRDDVFRLHH